MERRSDNGNVVQMPGAFPRIVGDVHIAFKNMVRPYAPDEVLYGLGHAVHMTGCSGHGLGQHATLRVVYAGRQIAGLANGR